MSFSDQLWKGRAKSDQCPPHILAKDESIQKNSRLWGRVQGEKGRIMLVCGISQTAASSMVSSRHRKVSLSQPNSHPSFGPVKYTICLWVRERAHHICNLSLGRKWQKRSSLVLGPLTVCQKLFGTEIISTLLHPALHDFFITVPFDKALRVTSRRVYGIVLYSQLWQCTWIVSRQNHVKQETTPEPNRSCFIVGKNCPRSSKSLYRVMHCFFN